MHGEWSWDAPGGSMEQTCAEAVRIGLPAVAFTEHADYTPWMVVPGELADYPHIQAHETPDGDVVPPCIDLDGYFACVQRCRDLFPGLHIISGIELGEPHWHAEDRFEDEFRHALRALAGSGRALEVNTRARPYPEIVRWRYQEGGEAVSSGSDAHHPTAPAHNFADAAAMVEANGFRPGRHPHDFWRRHA